MKGDPKCYQCGQSGHIARFCNHSNDGYYGRAQGYDQNSARTIQCFRCYGFGHLVRDCTAVNHHLQRKDAKTSAEVGQSSSHSTKTKSRSRNYSYATAPPQRISQTARVLSTQKGISTKEKDLAKTVIHSSLRSKSNRNNRRTKLETLPNELLLSLFEYLSTIHLLSAFHDLNSHFESLISTRLHACHLDFRSVSRGDSTLICRRYLPLIRDRIISIRLSDNDHKLKQTNLLSSYRLALHQFGNLRSLSLCHVRSEQVMDTMMIEWSRLHNLTHLKLIKCHNSFQHKSTTHLSNSIWSLPKLTHCYVDTEQYVFAMPTKLSLSIESVAILGHCCRLNELTRILKTTPRLRTLCIRHHDLNDDQDFSSPIPTITTLKLYDMHSRLVMKNLFQAMTNLSHLTVETFYIHLDGYQWEQIIVQDLPKLRVFRLKMEIQFADKKNNEQEIDTFLDSFRSRFWLEERRWFIRYHWKPQKNYSDILLYTIPLVFRDLNMNTMRSPPKSTCPGNESHSAIAGDS